MRFFPKIHYRNFSKNQKADARKSIKQWITFTATLFSALVVTFPIKNVKEWSYNFYDFVWIFNTIIFVGFVFYLVLAYFIGLVLLKIILKYFRLRNYGEYSLYKESYFLGLLGSTTVSAVLLEEPLSKGIAIILFSVVLAYSIITQIIFKKH